jgi:hypothetical protein
MTVGGRKVDLTDKIMAGGEEGRWPHDDLADQIMARGGRKVVT